MRFKNSLRNYPLFLTLENTTIHILDGNWGVFNTSFMNHFHSFYELHYVTSGSGKLVIDGASYELSKGALYVLPPKTNHEQLTSFHDPLCEYHLSFEIEKLDKNDLFWHVLLSQVVFHNLSHSLDAFFLMIADELSNQAYAYLQKIQQGLSDIFIAIIRSMCQTKANHHRLANRIPPPTLDNQRDMMLDEVFIYEHQTITLASLSQRLGLSIRQTQRHISDNYGVTFSQLKHLSRLRHAEVLLTTTQLSLEAISEVIGYQSYSSFTKHFKQRYDLTPSAYRKRSICDTPSLNMSSPIIE